ncbi:hypothetical protein PIB30_060907 [Stylosanthes scabra]|uniref:Uncharacterized protein n=1 Tax=Stylosanthes scabra TaxID=79078 RepID=A0ABU6YL88_9FABA|nr:hypothetical protein [Stylosanthes scabra]
MKTKGKKREVADVTDKEEEKLAGDQKDHTHIRKEYTKIQKHKLIDFILVQRSEIITLTLILLSFKVILKVMIASLTICNLLYIS